MLLSQAQNNRTNELVHNHPSERLPAKKVYVEVRHFLPTVPPDVSEQAVAALH